MRFDMNPKRSPFSSLTSFIKRKTSQKYRFNLQYTNKRWDGLSGLVEMSRYSIITGYAKYFCDGGRILDLGCGEGVLQQRFSEKDYSYYLGIDFSEIAIANAKKLETDKTHFIVGDLNKLSVEGNFDVIIYNESLYYLSNQTAAVRSLFKNLNPGGIFIISTVNKRGNENESFWSKLDGILELQDKTKTINNDVRSWTIQVYKMKESK